MAEKAKAAQAKKAGKGVAQTAAAERTFDPAAMDAAAAKAKEAFMKLAPAVRKAIIDFWCHPEHGFMKAGHKRLGRMLGELGKKAKKAE